MTIVLIHCGATEWQAEGRLLGRVELPPCDDATILAADWITRLRAMELAKLYHSSDELCTRTATWLSEQIGVPAKQVADLDEVDVGLWAGLTLAQLETRYETTYHELCESPLNVHPPDGESIGDAAERLIKFLKKQRKKPAAIGLVLRPLMFALARCLLEHRAMSELVTLSTEFSEPITIENATLEES